MIRKLYHGTDQFFEIPDLGKARCFKDFGKGFYLTTNEDQAMKWAVRKISNDKIAYVYLYEFDTDLESNLEVLKMISYNKEWLNYISQNRLFGEKENSYDLVYDKMADNRGEILTDAIRDYVNNEKTAEETLEIAKFQDEGKDQYCFKTINSLNALRRTWYAEVRNKDQRPCVIKWHKVKK